PRAPTRPSTRQGVKTGKLGCVLPLQINTRPNQNGPENPPPRQVQGRTCLEIGGIWIDEGYDTKMTKVVVKAQSNAYFKLLEKHPEVKDVFRLGNHLVWVTPSGTALIIDTNDGKEELTDSDIEALFKVKK